MTRNPFTQKNMLSAPRYMTILGVGYMVVNKTKRLFYYRVYQAT